MIRSEHFWQGSAFPTIWQCCAIDGTRGVGHEERDYLRDRRWINPFPTNATFTANTYNIIDARTGFFTYAYSRSPGMALKMENVGAKYPAAYVDADGNFLRGSQAYVLHLPPQIPAAIFWSSRFMIPSRVQVWTMASHFRH